GGAAALYYTGFSIFFDTPYEYAIKHSTDGLRREYEQLSARYDSLMLVVDNVQARDRNVFRTLFESEPTGLGADFEHRQTNSYGNIVARTSRQLCKDLKNNTTALEKRLDQLNDTYVRLQTLIENAGRDVDRIPAIQPVINKQLTRLTASYGMRYHPFYKTLQSHQGVDYTIPEGSSVFATADGTVRDVTMRNSTSGITVILDHGNSYETAYHHLNKANVRKGQKVHRGDIIAVSGDTGLSLAPHLHYEVRHNGMRMDPIHYFFMELTPTQYQSIMRIAQTRMQSFD
ncbi:MAG: peptidoglycan DD-metalloendopeptidase family protein, partial [Alistipes sp.]|nr:peptidoglycan DD-metalloendopeptidase family protein [Alistipes sp.]